MLENSIRAICRAILPVLFVLSLGGCGGGDSGSEPTATTGTVTITGPTPSAPLPSALLVVDETTLVVEVKVDDVLPQTCANLSVDQGNGTYSCNITLPGGPHTISLVFSIIDVNYGTVQVATASGININVVPGQTALADFSTVPLIYNDDDSDGISNLEEIIDGTDPLAYNLRLFIRANDGSVGLELFVTDGTSGGTFLLKDINTNTDSNPNHLTVVDGVNYFVATDGFTGFELWKTNGTTGGTEQVKDINIGVNSSSPSSLTAVGSTLYFSANDGVNGYELWKSDGTTIGTVMVKDIYAGQNTNGYPNSGYPAELTAVGSTLYFNANDGSNGTELWKSDGTTAGTVMVTDIDNGYYDTNNPRSGYPSSLTVVGSMLYFSANDEANGYELWKSDGTTAGTVMVKDIYAGQDTYGYPNSGHPYYLTAVDSTLYFNANDGSNGYELWKSDGTAAGTVMVKDIYPGQDAYGPSSSYPSSLTAVGRTLYFSANDDTNGNELWKSDGTTIGTVMVKDIYPGQNTNGYPNSGSPTELTAVGRTLYFSANDGGNGTELWKSNGTLAGTVMVIDINADQDANGYIKSGYPSSLTAVGSTLYFSADDGSNGTELWKSDGTPAGTILLNDINPGQGDSSPRGFIVIRDVIYFAAYNGTNGRELWRSDGTTDGTFLLADIGQVGGDSITSQMVKVGKISYFTARNGSNENNSLWRTDGKATGTMLVKNINIDIASNTTFKPLTVVGSTLYFSANDGSNGYELWKSDGTTIGTVVVKDIFTGQSTYGYPNSGYPSNFTVVDSTLYFTADDGVTGNELWTSDGTVAGTISVKDIHFGANASGPSNLTAVGSTLYFNANDGTNGHELWKSDGTAAGTMMVKDIYAGRDTFDYPNSGYPSNFTVVDSTLYFRANDGTNGTELWKSDGTPAGTVMVKDIDNDYYDTNYPHSGSPSSLTAVGSTLYFRANDGTNGTELWKSDGTAAGTVMVKDIDNGYYDTNDPRSGSPSSLTAVGSTLYFRANDGTNGTELWKSDGTTAGTVMVKDIYAGQDTYGYPNSGYPSGLTTVGSTLYFSANDGSNGTELWKSNGTAASTELVSDINANPGVSSYPVILINNHFDNYREY